MSSYWTVLWTSCKHKTARASKWEGQIQCLDTLLIHPILWPFECLCHEKKYRWRQIEWQQKEWKNELIIISCISNSDSIRKMSGGLLSPILSAIGVCENCAIFFKALLSLLNLYKVFALIFKAVRGALDCWDLTIFENLSCWSFNLWISLFWGMS